MLIKKVIILGIETSCDETALSLIEADGGFDDFKLKLLAETIQSQIEIHKPFGGVFPMVAKREHAKNLIGLLKNLLEQSNFFSESGTKNNELWKQKNEDIKNILTREPELLKNFLELIPKIEKPPIDAIAVTYGPGLEPALWVGINFAKALSVVWNIPIIPTNHMEGHIMSVLLDKTDKFKIEKSKWKIEFPGIALLISGGHTELVLVEDWLKYKIIGKTLDDAVGEAFDKVARILGLPYPGGPEISRLAEKARKDELGIINDELSRENGKDELGIMPSPPTAPAVGLGNNELGQEDRKNELNRKDKKNELRIMNDESSQKPEDSKPKIKLPRPMINSGNYNFSFSGLKTAVLYLVKKLPELTDNVKAQIAREFEDSATEVLVSKTRKSLEEFGAKTLILGGGVTANKEVRRAFGEMIKDFPDTKLLIPSHKLSTDNAIMIAIAGYFRHINGQQNTETISAKGNLKLS